MLSQLMKYKEFDKEDQNSRIYGVVTALVTNNKDPDKLGRVKLKYPWMGEAADKESNWARLTTFMAGAERGAYFLPEVDDEVLVAFENGDINCPYVIGTLWNGKDKPIQSNDDGKNNVKAIQSRSGHCITLDDTADKEKITLADKSGKRIITFDCKEKLLEIENSEDSGEIKISAKGALSIETDDALSLSAKKKITIKSDDDVEIKGKNISTSSSSSTSMKSTAKFEVKATSTASIKSDSSLELKGTASGKLESSGTLSIKATGTATVESSGITTLKGSMVKVN